MTLPTGSEAVALSSPGRARSRRPRIRPEKDLTERIGVFLCRCGGSVDGRLDIDAVRERVSSMDGVETCLVMDYPCSKEGREAIIGAIGEHDLDRFVVAGCSPKVVDERFMTVARESGVNPFMVEIANIREHCSMIHRHDEATSKAIKLVKAAVSKCSLLVPAPYARTRAEREEVLVYGNGMSAMVAVDELLSEGGKVHLVVPFDPKNLVFNYHDGITPGHLEAMRDRILDSDMVTVYGPGSVHMFQGDPENFRALLRSGEEWKEIGCGAAIVAWEAEEVPPLSVDGVNVITQADLEHLLEEEKVPRSTVMITMFEEDDPYPGRITHIEALRNALRIKVMDPGAEVTIVARDVLAFGMRELDYIEAQSKGVRFVRTGSFPRMIEGSPFIVVVEDETIGEELAIEADLVTMTSWDQPFDTDHIGKVFGAPVDENGYFIPTQVKLKPTASIREGVYLCGTGVESKTPSEVVLEARSAASRAMTLVRSEIERGGAVAEVDPELCSACLTCVRSCPFSAPFIGETGKAEIDIGLCQGCGICAGICPSKAIQLFTSTDDQISVQTEMLTGGRDL